MAGSPDSQSCFSFRIKAPFLRPSASWRQSPERREKLFFYRCKRMLAQMQKDQCVRIIQIPE